MRIKHNSPEKIEKVEEYKSYCLRGCLFFADEDHDYSLNAGDDKYAYFIDVENTLAVDSVWFDHTPEVAAELISEMCEDLDVDQEAACDLIDNSEHIMDDAEKAWLVQQYQGKLAHVLGYDCAVSDDEQGTVYIAYCVNRDMEEVEK